jgi:hypothetical protein
MKRDSRSIYAGLDYEAFIDLLENEPRSRVGILLHRNFDFRPPELQILKSLVPEGSTELENVFVWHDRMTQDCGIIGVLGKTYSEGVLLCVIYYNDAAVYAEDPNRASTSRRFIRRVLKTFVDGMIGGAF